MVEIPKSVMVDTGEQHPIYDQIKCFFDTVRNEVRQVTGSPPIHFERRLRGLYKHAPQEVLSDDKIHLLLYRQRVVATVTEIRDDFNRVGFDFFANLYDVE